MEKFKFKQVKNDKYHVIIEAENKDKAEERYNILYGKLPDD